MTFTYRMKTNSSTKSYIYNYKQKGLLNFKTKKLAKKYCKSLIPKTNNHETLYIIKNTLGFKILFTS